MGIKHLPQSVAAESVGAANMAWILDQNKHQIRSWEFIWRLFIACP